MFRLLLPDIFILVKLRYGNAHFGAVIYFSFYFYFVATAYREPRNTRRRDKSYRDSLKTYGKLKA